MLPDPDLIQILGQAQPLEDEALAVGAVGKEGCEHQGLHRHELDQDVEGGAGGVLQGGRDRERQERQ